MQKTRYVPPKANSMMEALRGLGYSTAAALADVVDNAVSAGSSEVYLRFEWDGTQSRISILDDGHGMTDAELEAAMTLGTINPLDERVATDLGRFGMGLKTASFSQCRRLTVASRREGGELVCLRWDLDAIATDPRVDWLMFEGPAPGSERFIEPLNDLSSGTLVLWELMDRVVMPGSDLDHFADLIDDVESRLSMTFHRLIEGPRPAFRLFINGKSVFPWDPFMVGHPAKALESPVERRITQSGVLEVQCHVLPHKDKLSNEDLFKAGGPDGWISQQGFYIYRNKRLLLAGSWLGLGRGRAWSRDESHRLARIRVDIPNTADADWKIDVKKSIARPPVFVRNWLTGLAENTRDRARKVFAFRGSPTSRLSSTPIEQAWRVEHLKSGVRYRIDEMHPAVASVIEVCSDRKHLVRAMLRVIEETVPIQRIWLDTAENKDTPRTGFDGEPNEAVIEVASVLFNDLIDRKGLSVEEARKSMLKTEPFQKYPSLIANLQRDE
ncbi:ATP-binding protein [Pectobacterium polaris]|uniref:ATP-binding protein n=1 Tax=Pectobacterium polaris TaxID=2042057 RepID=UPI0020C74385|nr:ATP-binding protein [Pectobacterium polaris]MDE8743016.1 ATP-binding protein [Pectobacterium polaris]